jgi:hypothetical protein
VRICSRVQQRYAALHALQQASSLAVIIRRSWSLYASSQLRDASSCDTVTDWVCLIPISALQPYRCARFLWRIIHRHLQVAWQFLR